MIEELSKENKMIIQEAMFNEADRLRGIQRNNRLPREANEAIDKQVKLLLDLTKWFTTNE